MVGDLRPSDRPRGSLSRTGTGLRHRGAATTISIVLDDDSTGPNVTPDPPPRAGGPAPFVFGAIGIILILALVAVGIAAFIFLR